MTEQPNVQRLRDGYDAFAKGDLATLRELMTEDVVWHVAGHSEMSGQYEGIDAVLAFFGRMMEVTGGSFRLEPRTFLADDAYGAVPASGTDAGATAKVAEIESLQREAQVAERLAALRAGQAKPAPSKARTR